MPKRVNVRCDETGVIFDVNTKRIFVDDIKKLTNAQISVLECGDFVVKQTGNQKHTYKVTYKEEEQGLCLTYDDASCVETVSYDYVEGNWVYNSTDISSIEGGGGTAVVANPTLTGGEAVLNGLEIDNTKYKIKKMYKHKIILQCPNVNYDEEEPLENFDSIGVEVLTSQSTQLSVQTLQSLLDEWLEKNMADAQNLPYIFNVTYAVSYGTYYELVAPNPDGICYSHTPNISYTNNECRSIYDVESYNIVEL